MVLPGAHKAKPEAAFLEEAPGVLRGEPGNDPQADPPVRAGGLQARLRRHDLQPRRGVVAPEEQGMSLQRLQRPGKIEVVGGTDAEGSVILVFLKTVADAVILKRQVGNALSVPGEPLERHLAPLAPGPPPGGLFQRLDLHGKPPRERRGLQNQMPREALGRRLFLIPLRLSRPHRHLFQPGERHLPGRTALPEPHQAETFFHRRHALHRSGVSESPQRRRALAPKPRIAAGEELLRQLLQKSKVLLGNTRSGPGGAEGEKQAFDGVKVPLSHALLLRTPRLRH